jgi:hypothetical protein
VNNPVIPQSTPQIEEKSGKGLWIILGGIIVVFLVILGSVLFIGPTSGDGSDFSNSDLAKQIREDAEKNNPVLLPDSSREVTDAGNSELDSATTVMESFLERSDKARCVSTSITKVEETEDYYDFWILQETGGQFGIALDLIYVYDRTSKELSSVKVVPEDFSDHPDALNEFPFQVLLDGVITAEESGVGCS